MNRVHIRDACAEDKHDWLTLWEGYLKFYDASLSDAASETTWSRITDPDVPIFTRLAVVNGKVTAFTNRVLHLRTWTVEPACYLEDLYVDETMRGIGVGRALIDDLVTIGKRDGWTNLYWHTSADNETARHLYDRYKKADGFVRYRLPLNY